MISVLVQTFEILYHFVTFFGQSSSGRFLMVIKKPDDLTEATERGILQTIAIVSQLSKCLKFLSEALETFYHHRFYKR